MNKYLKSCLSVLLCCCMMFTAYGYQVVNAAKTQSQVQAEIDSLRKQSAALEAEIADLKKQAASQANILAAVQKKISNTQAQILNCNRQIESINSKISANKAEISAKNSEIEENKTDFKKRLRAIYMSNTESDIQILLGADDFSQFLQLAQLTASASARDKQMIEDLVADIKVLEEKNAENDKLLKEQVAIKESIAETQKQLEAEEAEAQRIYNDINSDKKDAEAKNDAVEDAIEDNIAYLNSLGKNAGSFINGINGLIWPVPSCTTVSSPYGQRWGRMHYGIDIAGSGIYGKPIVAITDGVVDAIYNSCTHRDVASRCSCGGSYGNYVAVDHGKINGDVYYAMYAHMDSLAAGMTPGKKVKQGDVLGYVGTTGRSTGYHLHFGIKVNGSWVNPMNYYKR